MIEAWDHCFFIFVEIPSLSFPGKADLKGADTW